MKSLWTPPHFAAPDPSGPQVVPVADGHLGQQHDVRMPGRQPGMQRDEARVAAHPQPMHEIVLNGDLMGFIVIQWHFLVISENMALDLKMLG